MYNENQLEQPGTAGGGDWIGALIGAGVGLYDSYQDRKTAKRNTDANIAAAKSESELAYQRSVEQWNRQFALVNEYNSPESQMARFKEAGLNPHLIYGQGNAGSASPPGPPQYQPAKLQHQYQPMHVAPAISSILPTLMSVGSWMQGMKMSEVDIKRKQTDTERAAQMIDYLTRMNPKLLAEKQNRLDIFPTQLQTATIGRDTAEQKLFELEQQFRQQFGEDLWKQHTKFDFQGGAQAIGGTKRLEFLRSQAETQLKQAQASWTDYDITNPQAIIQLVLQGVMGLAGQTLRLSTHRSPKTVQKRERPRGLVRRRMGTWHPDH